MSVYSNFKVNLQNPNSTWTILYDYIPAKAKVLDVGCSSGYFDQTLIEEKSCIVDGVELDPADAKAAAKICRKVVIDNIETMNLRGAGLDSDYDIVIFADVLEHLVDPAATLRKVAKVLKSSGQIIFSIPNMANGAVRLQLLQGNLDTASEGLLDATHLHFYTAAMVSEMINSAGLHLQQLKFTTFDVPPHIIKDSLAKVGLQTSKEFERFLTSADSVAYQFVGAIGKSPAKKPVSFERTVAALKPRPLYEEQFLAIQQEARDTFQNMVKSNETSNKAIHELEKRNQELRSELDGLRSHPLHKISRALKKKAR